MPASRSRRRNPQNLDSAQSPAPDINANSFSARSVETSPGLRFHSTPAPSPPLPKRRSLRLLEALAKDQSPPPAMHANPSSTSQSADTSLGLGSQAASVPRVQRLCPFISTEGRVGKDDGDFSVSPELKRGGSASKRKRSRLSKRIEIPEEVIEIVEEEEMWGGDNVAHGDGTGILNFAGSQSGSVDLQLQGGSEVVAGGREKLSYKDKGKGKLVTDVYSEPVNISDSDSDDLREVGNGAVREIVQDAVKILTVSLALEAPMGSPYEEIPVRFPTPRREAQKRKAVELAPKYAHFKNEKEDGSEKNDESLPNGPCPFSTAMKIIEERQATGRAGSLNGDKSAGVRISWTPSKKRKYGLFGTKPPLKELSLKVLAENAEEIETLDGIPYPIRSKVSFMLCYTKKMNAQALPLLIEGRLTELRLSDCTWATDKDFEDVFGKCDKSNLAVLELDRCGRCMPVVVRAALARGPNSLPSLTKLSLKGAYSLSDDGLAAVVSSAPLLSSLDLSWCSLLTSEGITEVIDKQALLLRELYIDQCHNVDAMSILLSLKKVACLEVLSMAGIPSVTNKFVHELIPVCGSTIRELNFAGCVKLTSSSIKVIGENCTHLLALDIRNLTELTDSAIAHLANGCRAIRKLKLCRNSFSDEVIAAFVEASGTKLIDLSLNKLAKVGHQTAIAISQQCRVRLQRLDLSFCRNMSDEALGLIVDSCSSLNTLKLFGCTQVTDVFLNGHSNYSVNIVGLSGNILDPIEIPDFV